ncbi:MAG: hypothetical protein R3C59_10610 [Planctomycetaceae bacterium]
MVNESGTQPDRNGTSFLIPRSRRLTWDLLWFHRAVPLCGHDRHFRLSTVAEARAAALVRISWPAIFLKAYAIVAAQTPQLRQIWYRWPLAHLYQHPHSVGTLTVQREHNGEPWLFWGKIPFPESKSLPELQKCIDHFMTEPVRQQFRDECKLAQLPTVLRRLIWGWNIHVAKAKRADRLGTFFLSTLSGRGAEIQIPPSIHTGCLTYGPLTEDGVTRVTLAYDHRIMDGALVADCLERLEQTLLKTVREELLQLANPVAIMDVAA